MTLIFLLMFIIALLFVFVVKQYQSYKIVEHIPGPRPLPIVGNALELGGNIEEMVNNIERLKKEYGHLVRLCIGSKIGVVVSDPKYISQIFTATEGYYKGNFYDISKSLVGEGLLTSSGETWARQRRLLNIAFSNRQLQNYVTIFNRTANKLIEQLRENVHLEFVDITDSIFCFTLNTICKAAMKIEIAGNIDYHNNVSNLIDLLFERFRSPIKQLDFLYRFTSDFRKTEKYTEAINTFLRDVIQKRKQEYQLSKSAGSSILDEIFRLSGEDVFSDEEVLDHVKTFIFAGSDTVGSTLSFAIYVLGKYPDIQNKILKEISNISRDDINFNGLKQLKYTECVIKEVLRIYNPVSIITRTLPKTIYLDGVMIPENSTALIYLPGVHMSKHLYPEPEKFNPDRFLPENSVNRIPNSFIPFAGGARICIGKKFAMLEAKLTLAKIVKKFEIYTNPEHKLKLIYTGVLKSGNGLPIKLRLRETLP